VGEDAFSGPAAADVVGGVGDCAPIGAVASRNGWCRRTLLVLDDGDVPNLILRW
jgi:hypothetical protein